MDGGHEPTGTLTFYYTNQQSARLMFYHDHSYGITRLNVYAGEAAPYVLQDPIEQKLVNGGQFRNKANTATVTVSAGTIPTEQVPIVIQDKTFVPQDAQLATQDPTWLKSAWGGYGSLWLPHVYMPNQIASNDSFGNELGGVNAMGRWDYAFWFYPPMTGITNGPVTNPKFGQVGQPTQNPGTPTPCIAPEAFMDTPLVNGTAYPYLKVERKAYRFRILNACNDRTLNLQIYFAKSNTPDTSDGNGNPTLQKASGEVSMTVAAPHPGDPNWPATWPTDGRDGGVPDPNNARNGDPEFIQIGNEGGILPSAAVLPNTPVGYEYFRRTIRVLNVTNKTLFLGPAERADVVVDFSQVPAGSKLILYNDAPAAVPAFDSRYDYYTDDPDQTDSGGAPTTKAGYGPNTRTVMQFDVTTTAAASPFSVPALQTALQAAYGVTQDKPLVPESVYGPAFGTTYPNTVAHVVDTTLTFTPPGQGAPVSMGMQEKAIVEGFDMDYGRMNAVLGSGLPNTGPAGGAAIPYDYVDPPTDIITDTVPGTLIGALKDGTQIWRVDHQGVDTHAIHFHLFNVEVLGRVAVDGEVRPVDPNEQGWKETVRMNPGENVFIALRPIAPTLPWKLPDSVRVLDPALPENATFMDSNGTMVTNVMTNFGWEYVWHCHLLGHEENDMMRPLVFEAAPAAPSNASAVTAALSTSPPKVTITWANNAGFPAATNGTVQRSTNAGFTANVTSFTVGPTATSFVDNTVARHTTYYYRVRAESAAAASPWVNTLAVTTPGQLPQPPSRPVLVSKTRTSISIRWTNGSTTAPNAPRTSVRVQYSRNNATWSTRILTVNATTQTFAGLLPNTVYYFRAQSANGDGVTSSASMSVRTLP
jgi:FtsP/CotA-like multicopper oxidase with cupredoxin domain